MNNYLIAAIGVAVFLACAFLWAKKKWAVIAQLSEISKEADNWFAEQELDSKTALFSSYTDADLLEHPGATILVGVAKDLNGGYVGFVVEVAAGRGVLESRTIDPPGVTSHHQAVAKEARKKRISFVEAMTDAAVETHIAILKRKYGG